MHKAMHAVLHGLFKGFFKSLILHDFTFSAGMSA